MIDRATYFQAIQGAIDAALGAGRLVALLRIKLQRFREVNQVLGYAAGDALAESAGQRIAAALRPQDRVLRIGPGEFAAILPNVLSANHALLAANRLVREFGEPLQFGASQVPMAVVVGSALAPDHGRLAEALCRNAERAYGEALRSSERYALHGVLEDHNAVSPELLHEALINNRLDIHLQPVWNLADGQVVGAESLARWQDPQRGAISPSLFVPMAEGSGLISALTRWSLNATLRHCAAARGAGLDLPFSFNLSPRSFPERGLVEQILGALRIWDLPPSALVLEVTEGALMEDPEQSIQVLERLRGEGMRIAIDDFGVGYSSFTYLKRLPATELKIDQSFIADLGREPRTLALVRSLIDLAHHLGMSVVAEGIEDEATLAILRELGCDLAQGYLFGRPVPAADFIRARLAA